MSKLQFNSFTKNIDGQEYCSEVETLAENMVESNEQDATIVYPAPGQWATFRAENFRLTTDSLAIVLPYPIYKIKSLKIKPHGLPIIRQDYLLRYWEDYKYNNENFIADATDYVVLSETYNSLPIPRNTETTGERVAYKNQANVLTYERGSNRIKIASESYDVAGGSHPIYLGFIAAAISNDPESNKYNNPDVTGSLQRVANAILLNAGNPTTWEFQIEYIPMTSATKMKAHKAEATTQAYTQVVNQRAEVNNAEAFGQYLHLTAQKTGTEKLAIAKIYTKLADVPPIGSVIKHNGEKYRLVANSWNITNPFTFTVTHLLSKNWSSKSKHISVDQKYRNWAIPFDSYIWRTIYYEEFVEIGDKETISGGSGNFENKAECIKQLFSTGEQTVKPLRNLFFYGNDNAVVVPTTTMAIGNSFIISAAMQDNLSAGLRVSADSSEFCEEVLYCNDDGTLETAKVVLASDILKYDAAVYPAVIPNDQATDDIDETKNFPSGQEFSADFYVDKDPGEALKITIQTHFLPNADWVVIGNKLAQTVPFISDKQRTFKLYALKQYIRDGVDKLDAETLTGATLLIADRTDGFEQSVVLPSLKPPSQGSGGAESSPDADLGGTGSPYKTFSDMVLCEERKLSFITILDSWFNTNKNFYKAWAITDEKDNLLIGSNDINEREIYFNWTRKRSKK